MAVLIVPLITYLPTFYATEVGLNLSWVGIAFMVGRACDGVFDLAVGASSDATRSRFGRRKPWMLGGLLPLMIATWFLCQPTPQAGMGYLLVWLIVFYAAWTAVQIPYLAWGAELARDYHGRSLVFGLRESGTLVGIMLGTGLPTLLLPPESKIRSVLMVIALAAIVLLPLTIAAATALVSENPSSANDESKTNLKSLIRTLRRNRPYLAFITIWIVAYTAINIYSATVVLIITHHLDLPGAFMPLVFWQYAASIGFMPLALRFARALGKHKALVMGLLTMVLVLAILISLPPGNFLLAACTFALLGFPSATVWALPPSMTADLSDLGRLRDRADNTGTYMAGYNLALKVGMALGVGIAFPLLDFMGFGAAAGGAGQSAAPLLIVGCVIPAILLLACALLIWRYPIDARRHGIIQRRLQRRESRT